MKRKRVWLGLGLSAFFLYLAFRRSDFTAIWAELARADHTFVLAGVALMFLAFWLRAVRWRYLLLPAGRVGVHSLFGAVMIGYMALNLLPLRLGEFIRAFVLGRREGLSKSGVLATVMVERIFDGFSVMLLLIVALFFSPLPLNQDSLAWLRALAYVGLALYLLALAFAVALKVKTGLFLRLTETILAPFPRLSSRVTPLVRAFARGLEVLGRFRLLLTVSVYSLLHWAACAAYYWVIMFGFQAGSGTSVGFEVGYLGALFVLAAVALAIMIPSSPAFVGTFELACITALSALGVLRVTAESYAIVLHAVQFFPVTLAGIVYLYAQDLTLKEIQAEGQAGPAALESDQ